jgi:predicted 3-demethylubiquinone-9 3-methyltransferase (glyoxalase superfamily)
MAKITTFLAYDDQAEEAAKFYVSSSRTREYAASHDTE